MATVDLNVGLHDHHDHDHHHHHANGHATTSSASSTPGSIYYAAVLKDNVVVCQAGDAASYRRLAELVGVRGGPVARTFLFENTHIHYAPRATHNRAFICISEKHVSARLCYAFLEKVRTQYNFVKQSGGGGESDSFDSELREILDTYTNAIVARPAAIQDEINAQKNVMIENIERMLDQGETVASAISQQEENHKLHHAHSHHHSQHTLFNRRVNVVALKLWWKNSKLLILLGSIVLVVAFILIFWGCGVDLSKCDGSENV